MMSEPTKNGNVEPLNFWQITVSHSLIISQI